jgi:septal ring-binding cell division protein DamX
VAGRSLLADETPGRFSLQLMVSEARDREYVEEYLTQAARVLEPDKLYLVPAGNPQAPRIGVLFGVWNDRGQANNALAALPAQVKLFRPYVRSLDMVREDARRAEAR